MKRRIFLLLTLACLLLAAGCGKDEPVHPVTVPENVVSVETYAYAGTQPDFLHQYSSPEKVQKILEALLALDPHGTPTDLQITGGGDISIALHTADGGQVAYGIWNQHFCMDHSDNEWYAISREKSDAFYALLDELEPDTAIKY